MNPALDVTTARVNFWDAYNQAQQYLLKKHWEEIATYPDIALKPDLAFYGRLEMAGVLRTYVAHVGVLLAGYLVFIVGPNPHYADSIQATQDVVYVDPAARRQGIGRALEQFAEADLRKEGVQVAHQHVKLAHSHHLGPLLESEGWVPVETLYSKRLDV